MIKREANFNRLAGSTISGGSVSGWSASQNNVARQLMMYFMGAGMTKAGAAGIIGNFMQESGLNPAIVQSNGEGHYLAQWGGSRLTNLQSFASQHGLSATSVEAQAKFTIQELRSSYPQLFKMLSTTNDVTAAALAVSNQYERPAAAFANNAGRASYAMAAYTGVSPASGMAADGSGQGGGQPGNGGSGPSSILDLLTSPVDVIGGWLASMAVDLVKFTAQGVADTVIIPFWHWNQRSITAYYDEMFSKQNSWPMLPWTATFWGLGYFLLFTDPNVRGLKPVSVPQARSTSHARRLQSLPAKRSLIKPKNVTERTAKKPPVRTSSASIRQIGTLSTTRPHTVTVTGRIPRNDRRTDGETSVATIERETSRSARSHPRRAGTPSHSHHRAGNHSLSTSGRNPKSGTDQSR